MIINGNQNISFQSKTLTLNSKQSARLNTTLRGILSDCSPRVNGVSYKHNDQGGRYSIANVASIGTINNDAGVLQPIGLLKQGNRHIASIDYEILQNGKLQYSLIKNDHRKAIKQDPELYIQTMNVLNSFKRNLSKLRKQFL